MHSDPNLLALPRYWTAEQDVDTALNGIWDRPWLIGFRDITGATVFRTVISSFLPRVAVGHTCPIIIPFGDAAILCLFVAELASFSLDFAARQKIGGTHLTYGYFNQLAIHPPATYVQASPWTEGDLQLSAWFLPHVLELTYTAWDVETFAHDCGWSGPPFRWDEERRFLLRCELDAAFFHLYLPAEADGDWCPAKGETAEDLALLKTNFPTPRDAAACIMDSFPIVRRKDEEEHGEYRTKRTILEIYDAMQESIRTGISYQTILAPPPGPPKIDLPEWKPGHPKPVNWPSHVHPPKGCEEP